MQRGFSNILLIILVVALVGAGAYYLGKSNSSQPTLYPPPSSTPPISEDKNISSDKTASWKTYTLKSLGLTYNLPQSVVSLGELHEFIIPGEQGTQLFISTENSKVISNKKFLMGTTSTDYVAGRGGMFIDLQGFIKQNGKYYAKFVSGKTIELPDDAVTEMTNPANIQIIKIKGQNYSDGEAQGLPITGTPGQGKIGALLNVDKLPYQGLAIQMDLTQELTEQLFDQILSTFKFISP